jgi:ribosomal protein S18 acetylase RimI-like enzyme
MGLYESIDEPGLFVEIVAYASDADYAADQERIESAPEIKDLLVQWRALLQGAPDVMRLRPVQVEAQGEAVAIGPASTQTVESVWRRRWGLPIYSPGRQYLPDSVEGLAATASDGEVLGLVTYVIDGVEAEMVSLDALQTGRGYGSRLLQALEEKLRERGVRIVRHFMANDNTPALAFYQRNGFRLAQVHPEMMLEIRQLKPIIPENGRYGVPLRDLWELTRHFDSELPKVR